MTDKTAIDTGESERRGIPATVGPGLMSVDDLLT
jgi:hypothetical protein